MSNTKRQSVANTEIIQLTKKSRTIKQESFLLFDILKLIFAYAWTPRDHASIVLVCSAIYSWAFGEDNNSGFLHDRYTTHITYIPCVAIYCHIIRRLDDDSWGVQARESAEKMKRNLVIGHGPLTGAQRLLCLYSQDEIIPIDDSIVLLSRLASHPPTTDLAWYAIAFLNPSTRTLGNLRCTQPCPSIYHECIIAYFNQETLTLTLFAGVLKFLVQCYIFVPPAREVILSKLFQAQYISYEPECVQQAFEQSYLELVAIILYKVAIIWPPQLDDYGDPLEMFATNSRLLLTRVISAIKGNVQSIQLRYIVAWLNVWRTNSIQNRDEHRRASAARGVHDVSNIFFKEIGIDVATRLDVIPTCPVIIEASKTVKELLRLAKPSYINITSYKYVCTAITEHPLWTTRTGDDADTLLCALANGDANDVADVENIIDNLLASQPASTSTQLERRWHFLSDYWRAKLCLRHPSLIFCQFQLVDLSLAKQHTQRTRYFVIELHRQLQANLVLFERIRPYAPQILAVCATAPKCHAKCTAKTKQAKSIALFKIGLFFAEQPGITLPPNFAFKCDHCTNILLTTHKNAQARSIA